jgi:hypothetical protein
MLLAGWEPVTMGEHARRASGREGGLPRLEPVFDA